MMSKFSPSPSQVRAARALLAWSQLDLAKQAQIAASTVADFERGQRTPVANNSDAMRIVLEKAGICFLPGGAIKGPLPSFARRESKGRQPVRWVDATDLSQWAERLDSQATMPELLSRLIRADVGIAAELRFPSAESIQMSGWDGICRIEEGTKYIPSGNSRWEISTRKKTAGKATSDYDKRTKDTLEVERLSATFVFVTPRRWKQKEAWANARRKEKKWADIRVYDSDDLVHWIELYPVVGHWLAVIMGKRPLGVRQLDETWQEWSLATRQPLTTSLVTAGRDEDVAYVLRWLFGSPSMLAIQGESSDEAVVFLHAAISELPPEYRKQYQARCLIAQSADLARMLGDSSSPLIIVMEDADQGLGRVLADQGHHVYACYGSDVKARAGIRQLTRPPRAALVYELESMGIETDNAESLAHDSARSLAVLRRLMPSVTGRKPQWSVTTPKRGLLVAMLAGSWNEELPGDRAIIETLAREEYETVVAELAPLVGILDSPIRKVGTTWKIASPRDAWFLLAHSLTEADFERFQKVTIEVYESTDPRFNLNAKERWLAPLKGIQPKYSPLLRQGLGETLILFSLFGNQAVNVINPAARVEYVVQRLLEKADRELLWSISNDFKTLAEAAPNAFLAAVDDNLAEDSSTVAVLFDHDGDPFGGNHVSTLLWALETLAWNPSYLTRVAIILAKLTSIDPGGRNGNSPADSLRRIFLLWLPQTYASLEERFTVLDELNKKHPQVAWQLMLSIYPRGYDTSIPSSHTRWRDFSVDRRENVTDALIWNGAKGIIERLLGSVGTDPERWEQLIEILPNLAQDRRTDVITRLSSVANGVGDDLTRLRIWTILRKLLHRHREFPDAEWALPEAELNEIEMVYNAFEPADLIKRSAWLFNMTVTLPRPAPKFKSNKQLDSVEYMRFDDRETTSLRREAIIAILSQLGIDGVFALASLVEQPFWVGFTIASLPEKTAERDIILERALRGPSPIDENVALAMVDAIFFQEGEVWAVALLEKVSSEKWGQEAIIRILRALPIGRWTWQQVAAAGAEIEDQYWRRQVFGRINGDDNNLSEDLMFAVEKLIGVGRAHHAIQLTGWYMKNPLPSETLVRVLSEAAKEPWAVPQDRQGRNNATMLNYYIIEIFKHLDRNGDIAEDQIAALEWKYLPFLRDSERRPHTLHKAMATKPQFFVDVLRVLYHPSKESGVDDSLSNDPEHARLIASQAFDLLNTWRRVPGTADDGSLTPSILETWIKETRILCGQAGRGEIGDLEIGKILSFAPAGPDNIWPHVAVRDIIENIHSSDLERGIDLGVYNSRGVTTRGVTDGGNQERELAQRYRRYAKATALKWPRTSAMLEQIARGYDRAGRWHDDDAERIEW